MLPSCRSHKAVVVRPSATAEYSRPKPVATGISHEKKSAVKSSSARRSSKTDMDVDPRIGEALTSEARTWLGVPYRYAKATKSGTDCSGMVMTIFSDVVGLKLPRSSADQAGYCIEIPKDGLQPGDLVFFHSSRGGGRISHVGLYVGDNKIIHATNSRGVVESDLAEKYYANHYHSSGRVYDITLAVTGGTASVKPVQSAAPAASAEAAVADVESDLSDRSDKSVVPAQVDGQSAQTSAAAKSAQPNVAPADSVRRADEIRRNVTKAMKFGK